MLVDVAWQQLGTQNFEIDIKDDINENTILHILWNHKKLTLLALTSISLYLIKSDFVFSLAL